MAYRIVKCVWESGERYAMLVEAETGMPTWWPTLFVTTQLRNPGKSVSTMEAALGAIQVLLTWVKDRGIDLEQRFLTGQFLEAGEIGDLCRFAQRTTNGKGIVAPAQHYNRLTYIASHLEWLATEVLGNRGSIACDKAIERMRTMVLAQRPKWQQGYSHTNRGIGEGVLKPLMEVTVPDHPDNPFSNRRAAARNRLILQVLEETGMRKGELLGIQVQDINWSSGTVSICRRHDDPHDPRRNQPRAKTEERELVLTRDLLEALEEYIRNERRWTTGAKTHRYLFVVHRKGKYEGRPLGTSGLERIFGTLRAARALFRELHPHAFRYWWNWKFSRAMDAMPEKGQVSPKEQAEIRCYQMGWTKGSKMAAIYNRRFIEQKAKDVGLKMGKKTPGKARTESVAQPA